MAGQPKFDEFEAAALIENYIINYYAKPKNREDRYSKISKKLNLYGRCKYPERKFDANYRNINGMEFQTKIINSILNNLGDTFQNRNKTYKKLCDLLFDDVNKFIEILQKFYEYDFSSIGLENNELAENMNLIKKFVQDFKI